MSKRPTHFAVSLLWTAVAIGGCDEESLHDAASDRDAEVEEITQNLLAAGYPQSEIVVDDDVVVVGGDAVVGLTASREIAGIDAGYADSFRQYRTTNLMGDDVEQVCVDGSDFTGNASLALDGAIANIDALGLSFRMIRTVGGLVGCDGNIEALLVNGTSGLAGFPATGLPYSSIQIGDDIGDVNVMRHVIMHELGHCVGLRHTDYYNRSISCGNGGNEGQGSVGATWIPGTPNNAIMNGSVMNSCYNSGSNGTWTNSDVVALEYLYTRPTADIVWQHTNGQVHYWEMKMGVRAGAENVSVPVGANWTLAGVGDVTGDGTDDIVWRENTGQVQYWEMRDGKKVTAREIGSPVSGSWTLRGIGDMNGDGTDDLVWQSSTGQVKYWRLSNGSKNGAFDIGPPVSSSWNLRDVGDMDGDGTDDIVWQSDSGQVQYWKMNNGVKGSASSIGGPVGGTWALRAVGDVSGDGTDDIVWQRNDGQVHYWKIVSGAHISSWDIETPVGAQWVLRGVGSVE